MRKALWSVLLLLWTARGGLVQTSLQEEEKEACRAWTCSLEPPGGALQCPERLDGAQAQFCCGSCSLPYCYLPAEAPLEEEQCPLAAPLKARPTAVQPLERYSTPSSTVQGALIVLWLILVVMASVTIFHFFCYFSETFNWLRTSSCWRTQSEEEPQVALEEFHYIPSPQEVTPTTINPRLPYSAYLCTDSPPPYSVQDSLSPLSAQLCHSALAEDELMVLSPAAVPNRTVPGYFV